MKPAAFGYELAQMFEYWKVTDLVEKYREGVYVEITLFLFLVPDYCV